MRILVSGASGLIGSAFVEHMRAGGHDVVALVRRESRGSNEVSWKPGVEPLPAGLIDTFDAVVNLAGATTGKLPWTKKYMRELISSRVGSTATLVDAMKAADRRPKVFVSGSASGFYGDTKTANARETDPKGTGFLSDLAADWEAEANKAPEDVRVVTIRTTMVMSRRKGALGRLLPLIRLGIGGKLGPGNQWWAWISLEDEVRAIEHLILDSDARGPFNLTAPEPATCEELVKSLGKALRRPTWLGVPSFALRLAFGIGADELLLCNQKLDATKLLDSGFNFKHPDLDSAARYSVAKP
jgi:uncharacterized protein (TIGR01777 family)